MGARTGCCLLPLYPQYSTTTDRQFVQRIGASKPPKPGWWQPVTTLCCWFDDTAYVAAVAALVRARASPRPSAALPARAAKLRLLFSAHGLAGKPSSKPATLTNGRWNAAWRRCLRGWRMPAWNHVADAGVEHVVCYQSARHTAEMDRPQYGGGDRAGRAG